MTGLDISLRARVGLRLLPTLAPPGGIVPPPPPGPTPLPTPTPTPRTAMLPTLGTPGARYHAVFSCERVMPGYAGPLAMGGDGGALGTGAAGIDPDALGGSAAALRRWCNQTGDAARDLIEEDAAHRPRLTGTATIGGRLAAVFGGVANLPIFARLRGSHDLLANARTEVLVIHPTTSFQNAVWTEHHDGAGNYRDLYVSFATGGSIAAVQQTSSLRLASEPQVVVLVETPAGATIHSDRGTTTLAPRDGHRLIQLTLGASDFGATFNASMRLAAYCAIEGAVDAADIGAIVAAMRARFGIVTERAVNLVHAGDSIVEGVGATDTVGLGAQMRPLLRHTTRYWNLGVAGRTLAQCHADRAQQEGALFAPGMTNIALIDAGINDIGLGTEGAALYTSVLTPYVAALRTMGYRTGVATLLPQASPNYPTNEATIEQQRQIFNAAVRGNAASADFVVDRAADAVMGAYPDSCHDATLYHPSIGGRAIHPTTAGYARLAPLYAAAINAAVEQGSG